MTGEAFLSLAIRLSGGVSEAEYRTSVSRAYFGAFHVAREFCLSLGIQLPATDGAHTKLRHCLANCDDASAKMAANLLKSLRDLRNDADYEIDSADFEHASSAVVGTRLARRVCDLFAECGVPARRVAMTPKIRDYASRVLRFPVT